MTSLLLAEDNEDDRFLFLRAAKNMFQVTSVADGIEAREILQQGFIPDILVTDLKMPAMNGFELTRWVRQKDELKACPILVLSGSDERRDIDEAYASGANFFLTKPSSTRGYAEVLSTIQTLASSNTKNEPRSPDAG